MSEITEGAPDIMPVSCPSMLFARSLKSCTNDEEGTQVASFCNHELLKMKCVPSSPEHDPQLDLNIVFKELFTTNENWTHK